MWLIHMYVWRDSFVCVTWHRCTVAKVTVASPTAREHATTGWRRPIGCLISCITFLKRATNYRALLRKMVCKDKASYESSPPSTLSDLCQDWFVSLIWHIEMCDMAHWHVASTLISWIIHMCDIANSYVGHDSFMCHVPRRTWAIHFGDDHICDISHPYVWNDLFALICVTKPIHMCDMTHPPRATRARATTSWAIVIFSSQLIVISFYWDW